MQPKKLICLVLFISSLATSCTKSELPTPPPDTPEMATARTAIESVNTALKTGNWKISACIENGNDLTPKYVKCNLVFGVNGSVTVVEENVSTTGKWVTSYIDDKVRLTFMFQNTPVYSAITGDWIISESGDKYIEMKELLAPNNILNIDKN